MATFTTRFYIASPDFRTWLYGFFATVTNTFPHKSIVMIHSNLFDTYKFSKSKICHIHPVVSRKFSSITSLLLNCCPSAIRFCVISINLNSVYRKVFFRLAHVFKKIFKFFPSFTYLYSTTTIIFKIWTFRIITSLNYIHPTIMFFRVRTTMSSIVKYLFSITSARFCPTRLNFIFPCVYSFSALAFTYKIPSTFLHVRIEYCESVKSLFHSNYITTSVNGSQGGLYVEMG